MEAQTRMVQLISAYWQSQAVYVAAKLRIADFLKNGPRHFDELAQETGTHAPSLFRVLRALASLGVFAEDESSRFRSTPLGDCLRTDDPESQQALAEMNGEVHFLAYSELLHSVKTGGTGFQKLFDKPVFEYLTEHPDEAEVFDRAMVGVHGHETGAILASYDFTGIKVLADIGGGNGSVLEAFLKQHPDMRGILFDMPNVVERAQPNLSKRCKAVGGNFFEAVPAGADAYHMRHILHDWNDDQCHTILRNIHKVMPADGRLLVCEHVIRPGNDPDPGKLLDLTMLVIAGGKERTEEDFRTMYERAGFRLEKIVPSPAGVSMVEGRKQ